MPNLDDYEQTEEVVESKLEVWVKPGGRKISLNRHPDNVALAEKLKWIRESDLDKLKAAKAKKAKAKEDAPKPKEREMSDEEKALRAEYEEVTGKPAHWNASKATMEEHIAAVKEGTE